MKNGRLILIKALICLNCGCLSLREQINKLDVTGGFKKKGYEKYRTITLICILKKYSALIKSGTTFFEWLDKIN